jgi:hypothetical protein
VSEREELLKSDGEELFPIRSVSIYSKTTNEGYLATPEGFCGVTIEEGIGEGEEVLIFGGI